MMNKVYNFDHCLVLFLALFLSFNIGCKKEESSRARQVSDDFSLEGTWYFQTVEGEGNIQGTPQSDKDNDPNGFVRFDEGGTGYSEFSIELLNLPYGKTEDFTWVRSSDTQVIITQSDGDVDTWELWRANDVLIESSWDIRIATSNATITALLTKEP